MIEVSRRTLVLSGLSAAISAFVAPGGARAEQGPVRQKLESFSQNSQMVDSLKRGVEAMKTKDPSDPESWFFQAAMHAVRPEAVAAAEARDPNVVNVKQFWNKCPHGGENSANFVIWHRAYLYYFERILRKASGDPLLALPYWNYTDPAQRRFPEIFADPGEDSFGVPRNPLLILAASKPSCSDSTN